MNKEAKSPRNIRIRPSILHPARTTAVIQKKTPGQWLEEMIIEKVEGSKNKVKRFKNK